MSSAFRPVALLLCLPVAGCRGVPDREPPRVPAGIILVPNAPVVGQGLGLPLTASVVDINGRRIDVHPPLRFRSADTAIAAVSPMGLVTSRGPLGTVRITAELEGLTGTVDLVVTQRAMRLRVTPESLILNRSLTAPLKVELTDYLGAPARGFRLRFATDDSTVARVDTSGRVMAPGPLGRATITVRVDSLSRTIPVRIVARPATLHVTPRRLWLRPSTTAHLEVAVLDAAGLPVAAAPVHFQLREEGIVRVSDDGVVTSLGPNGSGVILVASGTLRRPVPYFVGTRPEGRVTRVPLPGPPFAAALTAEGDLLITLLNGSVARGTAATRSFQVTLPAGDLPLGLALSPDDRTAYVALGRAARVLPVDLTAGAAGAPSDPLAGGLTPAVVASPDGRFVYAGTETMVYRLSSDGLGKLDSTPAAGAFNLAHHPSLPRVYLSQKYGVDVVELDGPTLRRLRTFPIGASPQGVAVAPDGAELYAVGEGTNELRIFNLETGALVQTVPLAGAGFGVAVSPGLIVVTEVRGERVQLFDRATRAELLSVPLPGSQPRRPAIWGTTVVIPDEGRSAVIFID